MKKTAFVVYLLIAVLALSGCASLVVNMKVSENAVSEKLDIK